jgi:hypothetical protein
MPSRGVGDAPGAAVANGGVLSPVAARAVGPSSVVAVGANPVVAHQVEWVARQEEWAWV